MTERESEFWQRQRALLIEQEKAITEQRAAIIGQRKNIEAFLSYSEPMETHEPKDNEDTTRISYTA